MTGSSLTLGTAGSRRTVYLIDEKLSASQSNIVTTDPNPTTSHNNETQNSQTTGGDGSTPPSTFLMYNKISNVYGTAMDGGATGSGYTSGNNSVDKGGSKEKKKPANEDKNKDSAIWYEYGCV